MLRATDRVETAMFFLDKLKETEGKGREFGFYLFALVSATRSIGWVLQNDLRSEHGPSFDEWWGRRKKTLPTSPMSFETIRDLRNTFEKKGYKVPIVTSLRDGDSKIEDVSRLENVEYIIDPATHAHSLRIKISGEHIPTTKQQENETIEEYEQRMIEEGLHTGVKITIDDLGSRIDDLEFELLGFFLAEDIESSELPQLYSFEELIDGFTAHLSAMREVVDEAQSKFSP
jgi:hypothetical protein